MELQVLGAESKTPITIGEESTLIVHTGLQFPDSSPPPTTTTRAEPDFVKIISNCPFIYINETFTNGSFRVINPTTEPQIFSWKAHHLHSDAQEPLYQKETETEDGGPPPALCTLAGYATDAELAGEAAIREAADEGLQDQIDELEAEAGGFWIEGPTQSENLLAWVSPRNPAAADDDNFNTPFITIQGFLDAVGEPVSIADERRLFTALVADGFFDEALNVPAARSIRFLAMGPVVLGDGAGRYYNESTTPRDVTYNYDQDKEFADNPRPCLSFGVLAPRVDAKSTHLAYNAGWIISGSIIGAPGATATTTIELYLEGCHVQRGIDFSQPSGIVNTYLRRSRLSDDGETGYCLQGDHLQLMISEMTRYEEAINIEYINRSIHDLIQGDVTIATIGSEIPPSGIYGSDFATGLTWTGPAGSFNADNVTAAWAIIRGLAFAGGATLADCKNLGFAYNPVTPANWNPTPINIWDALDQIMRKDYGEMAADQNVIGTVISGLNTWYEVFAGVGAGFLSNTTFVNPAGQARIKVTKAGLYKVEYCASLDPDNDGEIVETGIAVNAANPDRKSVAYKVFDTPHLFDGMNGQCFLALSVNDEVRFMVRHLNAVGSSTIRQLDLIVKFVR
jgi:hypothetical protein